MYLKHLIFSVFILVIFLKTTAYAQQQPAPDSAAESPALAYAKSVYYDKINVRKTVFSGPEYPGFLGFDKQQYPYFQVDSAREGAIVYDGLAVAGVRLLYDSQADQVVMQYPRSPLRFLLDTARITDFTLAGHHFHRFAADSIRPAGLAGGFYDVLVPAGPLRLVAKRRKDRQEEVKERRKLPYYLLKDKYYVIENNKAVPVRTKKELYRLRPDKKKAVAAELRKSGLSPKKDREAYLLTGINYLNKYGY